MDKISFQDDIRNLKKENLEELFLMTIYCFKAYFKSRLTFGKSSDVTRDVIQIWREFLAILNEERKFFNLPGLNSPRLCLE